MLGLKSFKSVNNIIKGLEEMLTIKKEQFKEISKGFINQINFFNNLFLNIDNLNKLSLLNLNPFLQHTQDNWYKLVKKCNLSLTGK